MRCSISRRMASELAMSEDSIGEPERMSSRSCFARASRSAFCPRAAAICELISVSCCVGSDVLFDPEKRFDLAR